MLQIWNKLYIYSECTLIIFFSNLKHQNILNLLLSQTYQAILLKESMLKILTA